MYNQDVSLCPYWVIIGNGGGDNGNMIFFAKVIKEWGD
jgi:hypothetical protein